MSEPTCRECSVVCVPVDDLCMECYIASREAQEANQPQPGDLAYLPANDVMRNLHRKLLKEKNFGNASIR